MGICFHALMLIFIWKPGRNITTARSKSTMNDANCTYEMKRSYEIIDMVRVRVRVVSIKVRVIVNVRVSVRVVRVKVCILISSIFNFRIK